MLQAFPTAPDAGALLDMPRVIERVAAVSVRPRYTMLVLDLIVRVAGDKGQAGPWVQDGEALVPVRERLCDALAPMAARHFRRMAMAEQVRDALAATGRLPADPGAAEPSRSARAGAGLGPHRD
jgi:hypothetical protein